MSLNYEKYFTTGEFAKICNVEKHVLFHYDDIGLFCPVMVKENGYRYYSSRQYETFSIITVLKDLGMSLQDIRIYLENRSPKQLLHLLEEKENEVSKEIKKLKQTKRFIKSIQQTTIATLQADIHTISLQYLMEEWILCNDDIDSNQPKNFTNYREEYIRFYESSYLTNADQVGSILAIDSLQQQNYSNFQYLFTRTNKPHIKNTRLKKAGYYVVGYHQGSYETLYKTYQRMLEYAKKKHIVLGRYAYEEYVISDLAEKSEENYITVIYMETKETTKS